MSQKSAIVIIGGGAAGVDLAQKLDKKLDPTKHSLTLVTERDFFRHLPASLRAIVTSEGDLESKLCMPYDKIFGANTINGTGRVGTVKVGKAIGIEEKSKNLGYVLLEGNQRIEWNILVIATGSEWEGPLRWPHRMNIVKPYVDSWREKLASARSIVLVGAGAVGCELAGEIRDFIPGVELSIVQREPFALNPTYPESFRKRVQRGLEDRGVKVLTGDSITHLEQGILDGTSGIVPGRKVTTANGVILPADLIVPTSGSRRVNTAFLGANSSHASTINAALTESGRLSVLSTLQLATNPNVFAAGDVVAIKEQHSLVKAGGHVGIVVTNILALLKAREFGKELNAKAIGLKDYGRVTDAIAITNGARRGTTYIDFFTIFGWPIILGDWITAMLKSKSLFIGTVRGMLHQKA